MATASAAYQCSLALKEDGTVREWGGGNIASAPAQVSGLTDVQAIATRMCMAVKRDGTVWQIHTSSDPAPVPVAERFGGLDQVEEVSGSVVLKHDGTVWEFGEFERPTQVPGLKNMVAAADYDLALRDDGTVWQWAPWEWFFNKPQEPQRIDGLADVTAIAASDVAIALKGDGTVWEFIEHALLGQRTGVNDVSRLRQEVGFDGYRQVWRCSVTARSGLGGATTAASWVTELQRTGARRCRSRPSGT